MAQTYRPLEVIVVDDGSTDGTPTLLAGYRNRVRYVSQNNQGPEAAARNLGIRSSAGEFVAFFDADDLWHHEKLERQMKRFPSRPVLAGSVTHIKNFWSPELCQEEMAALDQSVFNSIPGYVTQTLLARKPLFDTVGSFNTILKVSDSAEWFLRVKEHDAMIELSPDVLVHRRLHQNNLTRRMASASRAEFSQLLKSNLDRRRDSLMTTQPGPNS